MTVSKLKVQKAILVSQAKLKDEGMEEKIVSQGRRGSIRNTDPDERMRDDCDHNFIIGGERTMQRNGN